MWRAAPEAMPRLTVAAEVREEPEPMPVTLLAAPAQRPYAFSTPGNQKGGWIDALLLHGTELRAATWAAVLDRSGAGAVHAEFVPVTDAAGAALAHGRAAAVRVTAPSGTWTIAFAGAEQPAAVEESPLQDGWLIERRAP